MADNLSWVERAEQQLGPAPANNLDWVDRAEGDLVMALPSAVVLPPSVSRHVTQLPGSNLPEGSTPQSDGINTKREGNRVADPLAGRNLADEADTFVRRSVKGLPIVGPSLDRFATGMQSRTSGVPVEELQQQQAAADTRNPGTATAGELTGQVAGTFATVATLPQAFGLRAGAGALERVAAGFGGNALLSGADLAARGHSTEEIVQGAAIAGVAGAVLTPWLARIGGNVGGQIANVAEGRPNSPAADALRDQANQLYEAARQSGIGISPRAFNTLGQNIRTTLQRENFSDRFVPQAVRNVQASLDDAVQANRAVPLERLELLRQEIVPLTRGATPELASQRRLASLVLQEVDEFGANLGRRGYAVTVAQGATISPQQQQAGLRQARELWRQQRNVSRIDDALLAAENSTSGLASGLRQEFSKLSRDRKFMSGLNDTEKAAIREMSSFANFRGIGMILAKMDPSRSNLRTMALLGGGAAFGGAGGAAGALGVMAAGKTAAAVTGKTMTRRAEDVRRTLAGQPRRMSPVGKTLGAQLGVAVAQQSARKE